MSDGGYLSINELCRKAESAGAHMLFLNDFLTKEISYNFGPFKKKQGSMLDFKEYFKRIELCRKEFPGMVIVPGVKVIPHYFFTGNPLSASLMINNSSKHLLLAGSGNPEDYTRVLKILENTDVFDPDAGDRKAQEIINMCRNSGLAVVWAHPGDREFERPTLTDFIRLKTPSYMGSLKSTSGYDAFGVPCYGIETIVPGGIYDKLLSDYIRGGVNKPIWLIGESDYGRYGFREQQLDTFTIFEENVNSAQKAISALKRGKYYVLHNDRCGEVITLGKYELVGKDGQVGISLSASKPGAGEISLELVRNGEVVYRDNSRSNIVLSKKFPLNGRKGYFRAIITDDNGGFLVTNPLFY